MSIENDKKTVLEVSAIENGTVIDHIPSSAIFKVMNLLSIDSLPNRITFGTNLPSKRLSSKAIIKIADASFSDDQLSRIAIFAPTAKVSDIEGFKVVNKRSVSVPDSFSGSIKCANPMCVTNQEPVTTKFSVVNKTDIAIRCHYCEKITTADQFKRIK